MTSEATERLYFRQLLSGRDFAVGDPLATGLVNYAYAVGDRVTHEAILIDPAYDPVGLIELVGEDGFTVTGAIVTHYHGDHAGGWLGPDHVSGIAELLEASLLPVYAQRAELPWLERSSGVAATEFTPSEPGDTISVGAVDITCVHTPGHTPGSQCLLVGGSLLSGDTLFLRGCGRTDLPGGDAATLAHSLTSVLAPLDPSVLVFPGHAYDPEPSATIGTLIRTNPVFAGLERGGPVDTDEEEGF
jgi:glyoxylase-like metal-dependent hydrolase (beta-lactamase superfamily II)